MLDEQQILDLCLDFGSCKWVRVLERCPMKLWQRERIWHSYVLGLGQTTTLQLCCLPLHLFSSILFIAHWAWVYHIAMHFFFSVNTKQDNLGTTSKPPWYLLVRMALLHFTCANTVLISISQRNEMFHLCHSNRMIFKSTMARLTWYNQCSAEKNEYEVVK